MAIDKQTIEKIKDAANIVDVVSEFVTLRKSGSNYKGLCPFHNEKTPSFIVSPARGTCHCFGIGYLLMLHDKADRISSTSATEAMTCTTCW